EVLEGLTYAFVKEYAERAMKIKANTFSPKVSKVIQYIERKIDSNITLEEIANNTNLARRYLSRIINHECHQSLSQFITALRIKKGRELKALTKMTVAEVAK